MELGREANGEICEEVETKMERSARIVASGGS